MAVDVVTEEQTRHGTYRERFLQVKEEFHKLMEVGGTPEDMEGVLVKLLKDMEDLRLRNEVQVRRLEQEIAVCNATAKACTTYSNLVVSSISFYRRQRQNAQPHVDPNPEPGGGNGVPKDTDVLKTICICGCQDEVDSADCICGCHTDVGYCTLENCVVCQAKIAAKPKKTTKKKTTKKGPTRKKSYTKKTTRKK